MELIKEMPMSERPREKAWRYGVESLSTRELLALLIRCGIKGRSALEVADALLKKTNGLNGIAESTIHELVKVPGISKTKALEIKACLELAKRIGYETALQQNVISSPKDMVSWLQLEIGASQQEVFLVVFLNTAHHILSYEILFKGTINMSMVSAREVFQEALLRNAAAIILVHNHPSGEITPSKEDLFTTFKMIELGEMMDLPVLDHIIVSKNRYFSLKHAGLLYLLFLSRFSFFLNIFSHIEI